MKILRTASCAVAFFALAAAFGVHAQDQDPTCDRNHYILSYQLGSWVTTGNLNVPRSGHTATLLSDGRVLVAGGAGPGWTLPNSAEIYDPATGSWTFTGSLTFARSGHTATLLANGKVLVVGGGLGSDAARTPELYDPVTGNWTPTGNLNTPRTAFTATLLATGQVLVAGGVDSSDNALASAELYDPSTGTWVFTGNLVSPRLLHTATALLDGRVLIAGGWFDDFFQLSLATAEFYDPVTGTWSSAARMSQARSFYSATRLQDGKVLVTGGYRSDMSNGFTPTSLDQAELFDPIAGTWALVGDLSEAREGHTATLLPDGEVLVAGGFDWNLHQDAAGRWTRQTALGAESYNPVTATWSARGDLDRSGGHAATLLPDGRVLVAGGASTGSSMISMPLDSAELFDPGPSGCQSTRQTRAPPSESAVIPSDDAVTRSRR